MVDVKMQKKVHSSIVLLLTYVSFIQAAKILGIVPFPTKSHFASCNGVLKSLANAGHEVTIITSFPADVANENYTSIIDLSKGENIYLGNKEIEYFAKMTTYDNFNLVIKRELLLCEKVLHLKEIQEALKLEKKYDAIVVEILYIQRCFYWIGRALNIPVIGVVAKRSRFIGDWDIHNPRHPVLVPFELGKIANYKNFYDRLYNSLKTLQVVYYWYSIAVPKLNEFHQKNILNLMSFEEFINIQPSLIFVNGHSSYFPRPLNPNVIEIGGLHVSMNKSLPKDIQSFLDGAKHGAILFTFGSITRASKMPENKIQAFKEAFAEITQRVIWKYEEHLEGISDNVMLSEWVPQVDILAHKNVVAFISHCGQGAIHESLFYAVPLISCPLFSDQHLNAEIFENLGIAAHLDYDSISKENVLSAINKVVNNTKYLQNMRYLSKTFKDRPMTPQQTVVYWTEYVIRHGGAFHLMSRGANLHWYQYYLLDVVCFIAIIILSICYVIYFVLKLFCNLTISKFVKKKKIKKT